MIDLALLPQPVRERIQKVRDIVERKTGVAVPEDQVLEMHMRCLEPEILAKAICFAITQDPIDATDDDDDA